MEVQLELFDSRVHRQQAAPFVPMDADDSQAPKKSRKREDPMFFSFNKPQLKAIQFWKVIECNEQSQVGGRFPQHQAQRRRSSMSPVDLDRKVPGYV